MEIKECIKGRVSFEFYRKNYLHYVCENDFRFRVPISDTGDACFNATDKGIFFMRYIRKEIEEVNLLKKVNKND